MRVDTTHDLVAYRAVAAGLLQADPLLNTVLLGLLGWPAGDRDDGAAAATYLSVWDGDDLVGTAMCRRGWPLMLGAMPAEALGGVAEAFARTNADAPGVQGPAELAPVFAERWTELTGRPAELHHGLRLYRLGELVAADAPGEARQVVATDRDLADEWFAAFADEVEQPMGRADVVASVTERVAGGRLWWWIVDGEPVGVAGHTVARHGFARIAPVYTPPEQRGRGYGSALTADLARRIRESGDDVCLFTDTRNATTNKIYAAIGFEPVAEFSKYTFE